ncbi:MAG: hypothetical protein MUO21_10645 [Nitrososphaeraceae archaeon]|nr:hypothetical protein [Nitrososphaeraceae archaeon]
MEKNIKILLILICLVIIGYIIFSIIDKSIAEYFNGRQQRNSHRNRLVNIDGIWMGDFPPGSNRKIFVTIKDNKTNSVIFQVVTMYASGPEARPIEMPVISRTKSDIVLGASDESKFGFKSGTGNNSTIDLTIRDVSQTQSTIKFQKIESPSQLNMTGFWKTRPTTSSLWGGGSRPSENVIIVDGGDNIYSVGEQSTYKVTSRTESNIESSFTISRPNAAIGTTETTEYILKSDGKIATVSIYLNGQLLSGSAMDRISSNLDPLPLASSSS